MFAPTPDPAWLTKLLALMQRVPGWTDKRQARFYEKRMPKIKERIAKRQGPKIPPMPIPPDMPIPTPVDRLSNPRDPNRY